MSFDVGDIVTFIGVHGPYRPNLFIAKGELVVGHRYTVRDVLPDHLSGASDACRVVEAVAVVNPFTGIEYQLFKQWFRKVEGPCERLRVEEMRQEPVTA